MDDSLQMEELLGEPGIYLLMITITITITDNDNDNDNHTILIIPEF
jgi:hypothetical protein